MIVREKKIYIKKVREKVTERERERERERLNAWNGISDVLNS